MICNIINFVYLYPAADYLALLSLLYIIQETPLLIYFVVLYTFERSPSKNFKYGKTSSTSIRHVGDADLRDMHGDLNGDLHVSTPRSDASTATKGIR